MNFNLSNSIQAIPAAIGGAFTDFASVFEFTAINYAVSLIKVQVTSSLPGGPMAVLINSSIDSAGEVAKLMLFNSLKSPPPPPTN